MKNNQQWREDFDLLLKHHKYDYTQIARALGMEDTGYHTVRKWVKNRRTPIKAHRIAISKVADKLRKK